MDLTAKQYWNISHARNSRNIIFVKWQKTQDGKTAIDPSDSPLYSFCVCEYKYSIQYLVPMHCARRNAAPPSRRILQIIKIKSLIPLLSAATLFSGCASKPSALKSTWNDLTPLGREREVAAESLRSVVKDPENRAQIKTYVAHQLNRKKIGFSDQYRLATVVSCLRTTARPEEAPEICNLIRSGMKHSTYYALATGDLSPRYFLCTIEIFDHYRQYPAELPDHDGSKKHIDVVNWNLHRVQEATGLSYPAEHTQWYDWWNTTGKLLEYDNKKRKYMQNPRVDPAVKTSVESGNEQSSAARP